MAYPPPQGNFSYQRAYPPGQDPYPPPIGFQNFVAPNPNDQPSQNPVYPPTTVAYHGAPEPQERRPQPRDNSLNDVPEVGFERYSRQSNQPSAQSASGVEIENLDDEPHDFGKPSNVRDERLSDSNSATRFEVCFLFAYFKNLSDLLPV